VAFTLPTLPVWVRFPARAFPRKLDVVARFNDSKDVHYKLNSHSDPSRTGESSAAKKQGGGGSDVREVTSNTNDPLFENQHRQKFVPASYLKK
jgi:hypothetical protein